MNDTSITSWERIASDWIKHTDSNDYSNNFLLPQTLGYLGDIQNKHILDLGCGEGKYAREMAKNGAIVTGLDGSETLINTAKIRTQKERIDIQFHCGNANRMNMLSDNSFEIILAAMVLMDVEDFSGTVKEIRRVLKPGGCLFMSILHPCFSGKSVRWETSQDLKYDHFNVDNYFSREAWEEKITDKFSNYVIFRHLTLSDYFEQFLGSGFLCRRLIEPSPTEEQIQKSIRISRLNRIPLFLFLEWEKK